MCKENYEQLAAVLLDRNVACEEEALSLCAEAWTQAATGDFKFKYI